MNTSSKTFLITLCSLFILVGCDRNDPSLQERLAGRWLVTEASVVNCEDETQNDPEGTQFVGCIREPGYKLCVESFFEFTANGQMSLTIEGVLQVVASGEDQFLSDSESGSYEINDERLMICQSGCVPFEYTLTGNTLIIFATDPRDGCSISFTTEKQ